MPITLSQIAKNTATFTMPYGNDGGTVEITYYPSRLTEKTYADAKILSDPTQNDLDENFTAINDVLCQLMKSWDVMDDDGTPFPIDKEQLKRLPWEFRLTVFYAIIADMKPKNVTASTSS